VLGFPQGFHSLDLACLLAYLFFVNSLERLNRAGFTYFLTGSMASNYWGIPRTTHLGKLFSGSIKPKRT
jgi:hypothetical protein